MSLKKHGWDYSDWHMLADDQGRPVGRYKSPEPLVAEQLKVIKEFLIAIQKEQLERIKDMSKSDTSEKTNMVFLAGKLKFDPKVFDNNVKALIDVGMKSAIQISIYTGNEENKELAAKLKRFRGGDFIKTVCILRPYGVKQDDDSWKNSLSVDITTIKNDPPQRQRETRADDDVPY